MIAFHSISKLRSGFVDSLYFLFFIFYYVLNPNREFLIYELTMTGEAESQVHHIKSNIYWNVAKNIYILIYLAKKIKQHETSLSNNMLDPHDAFHAFPAVNS